MLRTVKFTLATFPTPGLGSPQVFYGVLFMLVVSLLVMPLFPNAFNNLMTMVLPLVILNAITGLVRFYRELRGVRKKQLDWPSQLLISSSPRFDWCSDPLPWGPPQLLLEEVARVRAVLGPEPQHRIPQLRPPQLALS